VQERKSGGFDGFIGMMTFAAASMVAVVSTVWKAITKDGTLAAAGRQGADEIAAALRPFPETIHIDEPGTILNPTQGEIGEARKPHLSGHHRSFYTQADVHNGPSPSEIAKNKQTYVPDQNRQQQHEHELGG
jgi:hypothetical protein